LPYHASPEKWDAEFIMEKIETTIIRIFLILIGIITGCGFAIVLYGLGVLFRFLPNGVFVYFAICGALLGGTVLMLGSRRILRTMFTWPIFRVMVLYIIAAVVMLGFFMLVPVFVPLLGIPAGWYWGRRTGRADGRAAFFAGAVAAVLGAISVEFAVADPYTPANLSGMLRIPGITRTMVMIVVCVGLPMLTLGQYWLTLIFERLFASRESVRPERIAPRRLR
jgi:hypothetical protein